MALAIPRLLDPLLGESSAPASFAIFFRRHSMKNNKNAAKITRSGGEKDLWVDKLAGLVAPQHTVCIGTLHAYPSLTLGAGSQLVGHTTLIFKNDGIVAVLEIAGNPDVAVVVEVCGRESSESSGPVVFLCVTTRALWWPLRRFSLRELATKGLQEGDD